jgi:hypothetical protein
MEKNVSGKIKMNYTNYKRAIVECHGVELTKLPLPGGMKSPSKVGGRAQVQACWMLSAPIHASGYLCQRKSLSIE